MKPRCFNVDIPEGFRYARSSSSRAGVLGSVGFAGDFDATGFRSSDCADERSGPISPRERLASNRARWFLRRGAAPRRSSPASAVRSVGSGWSSRGRSGCVSAGVFAPTPTGPADPTRSSSMSIRFHWFAEICRKPVGTFRDKPNGFSPITSLVSAADHRASNAPTVRRQHTPTNHVAIVVVVATNSVGIIAAIVAAET
jgi:hypothetical protein